MIGIPIQTNGGGHRGPLVLVMVLEKENLDRMRQGDPLDFQPRLMGQRLNPTRSIRDLDIIIAYEEDLGPIMEFQRTNNLMGLIAYIQRGSRQQPEDGTPPVPLRRN
jgi:hypothetical protein